MLKLDFKSLKTSSLILNCRYFVTASYPKFARRYRLAKSIFFSPCGQSNSYCYRIRKRHLSVLKHMSNTFNSRSHLHFNRNSNQTFLIVRNHVKLMRVINSHRGFSKGTVLCGGY